jgi:hypothetical protein
MKKTVQNLLPILFFLSINYVIFAAPPITVQLGVKGTKLYGCAPNSKTCIGKFKRVYSNKFQMNRDTKRLKSANDISITFDDFSSHLEIGKERQVAFLPSSITMNIGGINSGVKETWILPDLSQNSGFVQSKQFHIAPEETDIFELFGSGTHAFYTEDNLGRDDLYDLQTDKLTFVGYEQVVEGGDYNNDDDWEEYQYDQLRAAVPLELGLNYGSVVKFEAEGDPTNYVEYTDIYTVIGEGTLKTYDDGDVDALKAIYKEETREFENNVEVSYSERYEIVFYSKKGHYIYADIEDPWNNEGEVSISNIVYQRVLGKTASVNDTNLSSIKVFPNPIKAGQTLTIESKISLLNNKIDLYNINAQKIATLNFNEKKNNQYEVSIPEKLASGIYFYKVLDKNGGFVNNGKIQIK